MTFFLVRNCVDSECNGWVYWVNVLFVLFVGIFWGVSITHPCVKIDSTYDVVRSDGEFLSAPSSDYKDFRIFIVTFYDHDKANKLLVSLLDSDLTNFSFELVLLNNHPLPFDPDPRLATDAHRIALMHNVHRSKRSWGNLAQDWNTGLLLGFESLAAPISSVVVCVQGDEKFTPTWAQGLWELHGGGFEGSSEPPLPGPPAPGVFSFFSTGIGDAFLSWTAHGVRRIGIFDERYSAGPGYQEADYFLCALLYAPDEVSINDHHHGRVHNAVALADNILLQHEHTGDQDPLILKTFSWKTSLNERFFHSKWPSFAPTFWTTKEHQQNGMRGIKYILGSPGTSPLVQRALIYPYFEADVEEKVLKGYLYDF